MVRYAVFKYLLLYVYVVMFHLIWSKTRLTLMFTFNHQRATWWTSMCLIVSLWNVDCCSFAVVYSMLHWWLRPSSLLMWQELLKMFCTVVFSNHSVLGNQYCTIRCCRLCESRQLTDTPAVPRKNNMLVYLDRILTYYRYTPCTVFCSFLMRSCLK